MSFDAELTFPAEWKQVCTVLGVLVQPGDTSSALRVTSISTLVCNYLLNTQVITFISHDLGLFPFILFDFSFITSGFHFTVE